MKKNKQIESQGYSSYIDSSGNIKFFKKGGDIKKGQKGIKSKKSTDTGGKPHRSRQVRYKEDSSIPNDTIYMTPLPNGDYQGSGVFYLPDGTRQVVGPYNQMSNLYNQDVINNGEYRLGPSSARRFDYVTPDNINGTRVLYGFRNGGSVKSYREGDEMDVGTHNRQSRTNERIVSQATYPSQSGQFTDFVNYNPYDVHYGQVTTPDGSTIEIGPSEDYLRRINENAMHQAAARGYWHSAWNDGPPSIPDMAKAAYHWWMGQPSLGGNNESPIEPITGMPPDIMAVPTSTITLLRGANYASKAARDANFGKKTSTVFDYLGKLDKQKGSKKIHKTVKEGRAWSNNDLRYANEGSSKLTDQRRKYLEEKILKDYQNYPCYGKLRKLVKKVSEASEKTDPSHIERWKKEYDAILTEFANDFGY